MELAPETKSALRRLALTCAGHHNHDRSICWPLLKEFGLMSVFQLIKQNYSEYTERKSLKAIHLLWILCESAVT